MGIICVVLFFGALIAASYRKKEYLGLSKQTWLGISYAMFSTAFLCGGVAALDTGVISFYLFDSPFTIRIERDTWPVLFYVLTAGIFSVGIIGWASMAKAYFTRA